MEFDCTNPVVLTDPPRRETHHVVPLAPEEARAALVAARGHRLEALVTVGLFLGLRQGEILGLRWADVDLEAGNLAVTQALQRIDGKLSVKAPKTEKSRRTLRIPQSVTDALRVHRDQQNFERATAGARWTDSGLLFVSTVGTPLDPRNVLRSGTGCSPRPGSNGARSMSRVTRRSACSLRKGSRSKSSRRWWGTRS